MSFGERLKALRLKHELTQAELARKLSLSKANISKYEADTVEPNLQTLRTISELFSVSIDYLLGYSDDETSNTYWLTLDEIDDIDTLDVPADATFATLFTANGSKETFDKLEKKLKSLGVTYKKNIKAAPEGLPLSPEQQELLYATSDLSDEDLRKAIEYVELLKLKRNS